MKSSICLACILAALSGPALADHGNPWASEDDFVLSKNHDANQARSIDTPGEDEMRGKLTRSAHGKLGGRLGGGKVGGGHGGQGSGGKNR